LAAAAETDHETVHGTCIALGRRGALLRGPAGCGKSDLALRFLFLERRAPAARAAPALVADDQVDLVRDGKRLLAAAPASIRGRLEVRGVGIVDVKPLPRCELVLVVDLVATSKHIERLPGTFPTVQLVGVELPLLRLAPFESSAPIKLALAVAHAGRG
jgi:serine kinase of HPr protein (carbohydrate metabolism regulator)